MGGNVKDDPVKSAALHVLESAWRADLGYCLPNADVYPHMWLWDSCFHSIAWSSFQDERSVIELTSAMAKQFANGFLPHMVYAGPNTVFRGPRSDVSCFTQPPVYALAVAWARQHGLDVPGLLDDQVSRALSYLTDQRFRDGLAFVVHPWETGCDDSPRWDSWYGGSTWNAHAWLVRDLQLVASTEFSSGQGDAIWNTEFVCAPSLFNGILSHAFWLIGERAGQPAARRVSAEIGEAMDDLLWDDSQGMYVDRPMVGGGGSHRVPTLDGVLSALGSVSRDHALACLDQMRDPDRFAAPWGLRYLPAGDPAYQPDAYWRGPAWPQLEFLAVQAARRWGQDDLAGQIADRARRAIIRSGWSEYWNPETGAGRGARPQTWSSLAAAM
jgi:Glycosyl hydrolase family 63 C-terminal domain